MFEVNTKFGTCFRTPYLIYAIEFTEDFLAQSKDFDIVDTKTGTIVVSKNDGNLKFDNDVYKILLNEMASILTMFLGKYMGFTRLKDCHRIILKVVESD